MWHITNNIIDSKGNFSDDDYVSGRKYTSPDYIEKSKCPRVFRLLDDDNNVYFEGRCIEMNFDPLDDIGHGYGCTEIQYLVKETWYPL